MTAKHNPNLTDHQVKILNLLSHGKSQKEIADSIGIALGTVSGTMGVIYTKLGVHNQSHAVRKGFELGVLTPSL